VSKGVERPELCRLVSPVAVHAPMEAASTRKPGHRIA
jgi:hypothetical protein